MTTEAERLADALRDACGRVRRISAPLSDLIPLMQQAADALDALRTQAAALAEREAELARKTMALYQIANFDVEEEGESNDEWGQAWAFSECQYAAKRALAAAPSPNKETTK